LEKHQRAHTKALSGTIKGGAYRWRGSEPGERVEPYNQVDWWTAEMGRWPCSNGGEKGMAAMRELEKRGKKKNCAQGGED